MAWNGSSAATSAATNKKIAKPRKASSGAPMSGAFKGIIALLVLAILGGLAYTILLQKELEKPEGSSMLDKRKIEEIAADILDTGVEVDVSEQEDVGAMSSKEPEEFGIGSKVTNSFGQVYTVAHVSTAGVRRVDGVIVEERRLFVHDSECVIDDLLTNEPGLRIYGSFDPDSFDQDFANAIVSKIEIDENDSEEEVERKRMVIEAKETIKEAIRAGERPSDLIIEARRDINKLADMRDNYVSILAEMQNDGASEQEIEDYYEAVNKKFAEHQIPTLLSPANRRIKMRMRSMLKR